MTQQPPHQSKVTADGSEEDMALEPIVGEDVSSESQNSEDDEDDSWEELSEEEEDALCSRILREYGLPFYRWQTREEVLRQYRQQFHNSLSNEQIEYCADLYMQKLREQTDILLRIME